MCGSFHISPIPNDKGPILFQIAKFIGVLGVRKLRVVEESGNNDEMRRIIIGEFGKGGICR